MSAAREARPAIRFVDEYCQLFEGLFPEVRSYEAFKLLHLGMISEVKHKSLPAIALICRLRESSKIASLSRANLLGQSSSYAPQRLELILKVLNG